MRYYYKVTTSNNRSVSMRSSTGMSLTYEIDKWTSPKVKGSKIFIFKELKDAEAFADTGQRIYRCIASKPRKLNKRLSIFCEEEHFQEFWKCIRNKKRVKDIADCPIGTYGAEKIKIIDEVL